MKIATEYEIVRGVTSDSRVTLPLQGKRRMPVMVAMILDEDRIKKTGEIEHWKSVFIDERIHDWDYDSRRHRLRYYSHAMASAITAEECGDVNQRCDIIVIYEFQS